MAYPDKFRVFRFNSANIKESEKSILQVLDILVGHYIDNYFNIEIERFNINAIAWIMQNTGVSHIYPDKFRRDFVEAGLLDPVKGTMKIEDVLSNIKSLYLSKSK
jgi:hypothetical protein